MTHTGNDDDDDDALAHLADLTDDQLERELTIATARQHRDERYNELLAEHERRRADPRD